MISFAEKRSVQNTILEQNKILASNPSFSNKRQAQKIKSEAMIRLGLVSQKFAEIATPKEPDQIPSQQDNEDVIASREPTSQYYEFDPNRKQSQRKKDNEAAMSLLARIDAGEIDPNKLTGEQRLTLAKYSGTGGALIGVDGKKGSAYEYYTPKPIAEGIWTLLEELGFEGGKVLDPSAGVGIFGATAPLNAAIDAVELNQTSGRINGLVNGGPGYVATISPFEKVAANTPDEQYDAVVTNVPFGGVADRGGNQLHDSRYQKEPLQNYFILRSLEKLKPGGLAVFITPPRCVSGKGGKEEDLRVKASYMAEFMGAYRLPNSVFGTASADTMTDVIAFRKYDRETLDKISELREQSPQTLIDANVQWQPFIEGQYFNTEGKRFILGEFVPKDPNKFRDVDRVMTPASLPEIARMLRRFPDSRINWDLLGTTETSPIVYRDGDTITQSGQTLQMQDGRWVPMARNEESADMAGLLGKLATPYSAFENRIQWSDASKLFDYMNDTSQALDIPGWMRAAVNELRRLPDHGDRAKYWNAGVVGLAVSQVLDERLSEETGVKYIDEYPALSDAMQVVYSAGKSRPSSLGGKIRDAMKRMGNHYQKKTGFSAVWRGDVQQSVTPLEITADSGFEGLRYKSRSIWASIDDAKGIFGHDFNPIEDHNWCISPDGRHVTRADDYYTGNYADFLRRSDAEIAQAADDTIRAKLLRQKLDAESRLDKIDVSKLTFNLFSPYVSCEEKAEFLRRFVHPSASVVFDEKTGHKNVDINVPGSKLSDNEKLLNRIGDYLKNGTITLGGAKLDMSDTQALGILRKKVVTANEQFNGWVRGNKTIMGRMQAKAGDPSKLRFSQVDDESPLVIAGMSGDITLHGYQNAFVRRMSRNFEGINGHGVGLGKAQPLDSGILTPDGWKKMRDIRVGDKVIAVDGTAVDVTGVFPQGEKEIFEVEFSDGSITQCCDEHLWFTRTEKDRKNQLNNNKNKTGRSYPGSIKPLSEIRGSLIHGKKQKNHQIPMVLPVEFNERKLQIPPYILGVLLGDGSLTTHSVSFTPGDEEIAEKVRIKAADAWPEMSMKERRSLGRSASYAITNGNESFAPNRLLDSLRGIGLIGAKSENKFIPLDYLFSTFDHRINLLHGLMDTDGYVSKDGITVQFSSASKRLAEGMVELVRSFGGLAKISTKIPTYKYDGEKRKGKICYTVSIRMPKEINPFSLSRKASKVVPKSKYIPVRYFTRVESIGVKEAQCISIDHPSHLYVTDDYIVTHNTFQALSAIQYVQSIGVKNKTFIVMPNSVLSNWRKEATRAYATMDDSLFIGLRVDQNGKATVSSSNFDSDLVSVMENRHRKIFMTLEAFERIRLREETIHAYEQFLRKADASFSSSEDKKADERAKGKQSGLMSVLSSKTGSAPYLEDLGVDSIVIDEAHMFKNSAETIDFKSAKFLSMAPAAKRGVDAQAKAWYIRGKSPLGDGVLLLTATPITNSPLEVYSMLSLSSGHERVNDMCLGIKGADDFMNIFVQKENQDDVTMDGVARTTDVFVGLNNVEVLRKAIDETASIKNADDVGEQIVVPDREDKASQVTLTGDIVSRLKLYKSAFRFAIDEITEKVPNRGSKDAYAEVSKHFGEEIDLIGHPFNLINKMTMLIADPELDQRATFYTFIQPQADKAKAVIDTFNARKISEERARPGPMTEESAIIGKKIVKDSSGDGYELLKIAVRARIIAGNRIIVDTIDPASQSAFEDMADKQGLDLDVSVPPKLAAMLENFQNEQATPRGVDENGGVSSIVKQIIFCDILPLHNKIKRLLAKRAGVPSSAIAIITGKTNNSPDEILAVQDGFNANGEGNKYRTVIANEKAEVGINLQKGTQAIHHLTIGWTPDSLEQRNGRGVRQGNKTQRVNVYHYDADGTFDTSKRSMVNKKADWIGQVMDIDGGGSVSVTGGLSKEQMEALIDTVGDSDAMKRLQETIAAKEAEARATTNREKQMINIDTIRKQRAFLQNNPSPAEFVIRRIISVFNYEKQILILNDRINNPKATESAVAKNKQILSELNARVSGMRRQIEASGKIYQGHRSQNQNGQKDAISIDDFFQAARRVNRLNDEKMEEMLKSQIYPSFYVDSIDDSEIANEWQMEVDMAQSMIDESTANFVRQASEKGSYPAGIAKATAESDAFVVDGKPIVTGTISRQDDGSLAIFDVSKGYAKRGAKGDNGIRRIPLVEFVRGGEMFYPGSAEYDSLLNDAASIEDEINDKGFLDNGFSDIVPEIAQRRKVEMMASYSTHGYMLPQPYFPFVITKDNTAVRRSIKEAQKSVVKSIQYGSFVAPASLAVVKIDLDSSMMLSAMREYAIANNLTLTIDDFDGSPYNLSAAIKNLISADDFGAALTGRTQQEIREQVGAFMREKLSWFDYEDKDPSVDYLPYELRVLKDAAIKRLRDESTPQQAGNETVATQDDAGTKIIGIRIDTVSWDAIREWKEYIKEAANEVGGGRYKWDKLNKAWNVYQPVWDKLMVDRPNSAPDILVLVDGTLSKI